MRVLHSVPGDAVEVEGVVAHPPGHGALLAGGAGLVGLALDAQVHDVVPADGAVVHHDVPGPQSDGVPLLHLKPLLVLRYNVVLLLVRGDSGIQFTKFNVCFNLKSQLVALHEHDDEII